MIHHRRSGFLLGELIGTLSLIVVASTLVTLGTAAILRTQRRVAETAAGYHAINSLLDTLRTDTRAALSADTKPADDEGSALKLRTADGTIRYRFADGEVTRQATGSADRRSIPRRWRIKKATVTIELTSASTVSHATRAPLARMLAIRICWRGQSKQDVDPTRRFEADFLIGRGYGP